MDAVFCGFMGIINDEGRYDESNVQAVCGTPFAAPGIHTVPMSAWKSIYLHDPSVLTPEMIRELAVTAGCHLYTEVPRPICANNKFVSLHTACTEELTVHFPTPCVRITELFSGQTWYDARTISIMMKGPETALFKLEN
mgnify:CR=1 FL=1